MICIALGAIGIVIPGMPTTIFLIAATACFAKSSPCLHAWLLYHPYFGPVIRNWQQSRSIPKKAKILALIMMALACLYTSLILSSSALILSIFAVMLIPAIFLYRLPLTENITKDTTENQPIVESEVG